MRLSEEELAELIAKGLVIASDTGAQRALVKRVEDKERSEHQEQVRFFNWVRERQGGWPELERVFAVPNGGARHIAVATKLKKEGVRRGVPDILFPYQSRGHTGLAIEMKIKGGKVSDAQEDWIAYLRQQGWYAVVCWSAEEAIAALQWYLNRPD